MAQPSPHERKATKPRVRPRPRAVREEAPPPGVDPGKAAIVEPAAPTDPTRLRPAGAPRPGAMIYWSGGALVVAILVLVLLFAIL